MKIATWNVNSLRTRLDHVLNWWDAQQPDVLCLQETKVMDENFPTAPFAERGLHIAINGQKSYNGVATLSRHPIEKTVKGLPDASVNGQARVLTTRINNMHIINVYMPQGGDIESEKFQYKRSMYQALHDYLTTHFSPKDPLVLCGDMNIAHTDKDVDDPAKRSGNTMFTAEEHQWLARLTDWGLQDAFRLVSDEAGVFSWWDYRQLAFQKNRGMRIDMLYTSPPLHNKVQDVTHHRPERKKQKPSDHIPVVLTLADIL